MLRVSKISLRDVSNILDAAHSVNAASCCTSRILAGICYKLTSYWLELAESHYKTALKDNRTTPEYIAYLRANVDAISDCFDAWLHTYSTLCDTVIHSAKNAKTRRAAFHANRTFERVLFSHWSEKTGCWTFNGYTFG